MRLQSGKSLPQAVAVNGSIEPEVEEASLILTSKPTVKASPFKRIRNADKEQPNGLANILRAICFIGLGLLVAFIVFRQIQSMKLEEAEKESLNSLQLKASYAKVKQISKTEQQNLSRAVPEISLPVPQIELPKRDETVQEVKVDLDVNGSSFNLWDLSLEEKEELLRRYSAFKKAKETQQQSVMSILDSKDAETAAFFQDFEKHSEEINWSEISFSQQQSSRYKSFYSRLVSVKESEENQFLRKYSQYRGNKEKVYKNKNINIQKSQIYNAIQSLRITGHGKEEKVYQMFSSLEKQYLEQKYNISKYPKELKACVIVPTFNNVKNNRFLWNLESILQQEYSNLKVVIIDDGSTDNTTARIAKHLSWKNAPKDRFTLIKSSRRNKSLMSFYYGAHKYCGLGEIIYTIDGDDELIGTQVFKLINAIYQQEKVYTLYTTYINKSMKQLRLGYNQNYDLETVNSNSYRQDKSHAYSHLRTMMSDTFLLVNSSSLRDKDGKFYEMITDNAVYFCALELSCKRVRNLQEVNYLYDFNTGINIVRTANMSRYNETMAQIQSKQPYQCLDGYFREAQEWYNNANPE